MLVLVSVFVSVFVIRERDRVVSVNGRASGAAWQYVHQRSSTWPVRVSKLEFVRQ